MPAKSHKYILCSNRKACSCNNTNTMLIGISSNSNHRLTIALFFTVYSLKECNELQFQELYSVTPTVQMHETSQFFVHKH